MPQTRLTRALFIVSTITILTIATVPGRTAAQLTTLPTKPAVPADNPTTPEKVALGRLLFWDPVLSGASDVACATCHHPSFGYADGLDLAIGVNGVGLGTARHFAADQPARLVKRNSPTVLNAAFNGIDVSGTSTPSSAPMFWDSRVQSLEAQALEPIKALEEMRGDGCESHEAVSNAVARVAAIPEYQRLFARAFGSGTTITSTNLARAIAAFERSLVTTNAPFDRYMRGDTSAMTDRQVRGMTAFQTMGCATCHSGPMFSDYKTHVLGVPENSKLAASDHGADNRYAFRTPSLRNLAYTAPYMHNGAFTSLNAVVNFYNQVGGGRGGGGRGGRGGRGPAGPAGPAGPGGQGGQGAGTIAAQVNQNAPQQGRGRGGRGGTPNPNVSRQDLDPLLRQVNVRGGGRQGGRQDVIAFLDALNDDGFDKSVPKEVPSGLRPGGRIE